MDGGIDLSSLLSAAGSSDAISNAMNILMKKPELIEMVANELGFSDGGQKNAENNEAPGADSAPKNTNKVPSKEKNGDRERLLLALKPYLSERRRSAIDVMINLGSIGDLIGNFDPNMLKVLMGGKNV